ncbi:MAG: sulfite exporter TauE/SafE family protein [Pseudomonadales bacterium]|nr:sulfite exporter TauE/SafE family protein [Pseudomonadales bacterium]
MELSFFGIAALLISGFIAGFINTLAGGGSMLTLPALMMLGLPADIANATNRVGVLLQSVIAIKSFKKYDRLDTKAILPMMLPTLSGALIGSLLASYLPVWFLKPTLLISMMAMALVMLIAPKFLMVEEGVQPHSIKDKPMGFVMLFLAGVYGGFVQAGVGFILLAALAGVLRYDLVRANALKMVATLFFAIVALAVFIVRDQVMWVPGLILSVGTMTGAAISVKFSLNVSQTTLKWILFVMVSISCLAAFSF